MTRVTNLGRKRTYHEAGFNNTFKDEKQEENTVETPSPSKKQKRKKDKDAHSRKETSEKRRLKRIAERHADTICFACRERGHSSKECPTAPQSDRIEQLEAKGIHGRAVGGICYRCGSTRHRLNRCKKPENPNDPLPFAACFVCSGTGHLASKCPQNEGKGIYPKGGACKLCGETSHLAKDCPLRQDEPLKGGILLAPTQSQAGADEDDFHVVKRRRKQVDEEEKLEERVQRLGSAIGQAKAKISSVPAAQKAPTLKKAKVVKF